MKAINEWSKKITLAVGIALLTSATLSGAPPQKKEPRRQPQSAAGGQVSLPAAVPSGRAAIKVHGHWIIEVRNPDGSLATREEFENALTPGTNGGQLVIAGLLARESTPGRWWITLGKPFSSSAPATSPCVVNRYATPQVPAACLMYEGLQVPFLNNQPQPPIGTNADSHFNTVTAQGVNDTIVLQGNATAYNSQPSQVTEVSTFLTICDRNAPPTLACEGPNTSVVGATNVFGFTAKTLNRMIPIQSGQVIQVTVIISFQ
jgi:hypothetical protein